MKLHFLQLLIVVAFIIATIEGFLDYVSLRYYEKFNITGKLCIFINKKINNES